MKLGTLCISNIVFASIVCLLIFACTDKSESADNKVQESLSVTGKVYGWTKPPLDLTKCEEAVPANKSFPELLFLDDSSFIKIMRSTCDDLGVCKRYYSGKYKIDKDALFLTFNSNVVVCHEKSETLASAFVEVEKSEFTKERLTRRQCSNNLFFEECDTEGHLMTPKSDTLSKEIQYLKENKIFDLLLK